MTGFRFVLYVAGTGPRSEAAEREFGRLCAQRLSADEYEVAVVDVLQAFQEADAARILVTPTLVRTHPRPAVRVIGDITASTKLADVLGLPPDGASR